MSEGSGEHGPDRADFWTGLVLAVVGLASAVGSWKMPRLQERGINPLTVPGIVPGILGVALLVLGLVLALRGRDPRHVPVGLEGIIGTGRGRVNLATAFGLNALFALVLVGHVPFWLAAFGYLAAFMGAFGSAESGTRDRRKQVALVLVVSASMTAGIVYLFETLFLVRLP